jgi:hypothetical protein
MTAPVRWMSEYLSASLGPIGDIEMKRSAQDRAKLLKARFRRRLIFLPALRLIERPHVFL